MTKIAPIVNSAKAFASKGISKIKDKGVQIRNSATLDKVYAKIKQLTSDKFIAQRPKEEILERFYREPKKAIKIVTSDLAQKFTEGVKKVFKK